MKSHFSRSKPKIIHYGSFKRSDEQRFIVHVKNADFPLKLDDPNENYFPLTSSFFNSGEARPT